MRTSPQGTMLLFAVALASLGGGDPATAAAPKRRPNVLVILADDHRCDTIRALGNDSELAEVVGMPAKRLRHISFIVGSGLVGVSAMLIGLNVGIIDFNMGNEVILMATVAMIIGGLGNVGAAAGGGFVLGMIQNIAIWKIESKWQMALSFAILIVVLLFKPNGLFGEKRPAAGL